MFKVRYRFWITLILNTVMRLQIKARGIWVNSFWHGANKWDWAYLKAANCKTVISVIACHFWTPCYFTTVWGARLNVDKPSAWRVTRSISLDVLLYVIIFWKNFRWVQRQDNTFFFRSFSAPVFLSGSIDVFLLRPCPNAILFRSSFP